MGIGSRKGTQQIIVIIIENESWILLREQEIDHLSFSQTRSRNLFYLITSQLI